ncbi:hypothetical protein [Dokdonia pacifica]|nr:hypothetical protein [Dokdonia pacifica]
MKSMIDTRFVDAALEVTAALIGAVHKTGIILTTKHNSHEDVF